MSRKESLEVTVDVTNTGDFDGKEVVQLYIRDLVGSVTRPVKELKGFQKVELKKGETNPKDDLDFIRDEGLQIMADYINIK